jgi:hypothetical protein
MISTHLYFYKHVLNDMGFIFQNKIKKPTYLLNCLNKMYQKIISFEYAIIQNKSDQIMAKNMYLQMIEIHI